MITTKLHGTIKALKVGDRVGYLLNNTDSKLKIHSIFDHAVNFIDRNDWIITLLPESYCIGPQGIILDHKEFSKFKSMELNVMDLWDFSELLSIEEAEVVSRKPLDNSIPIDMFRVKANKEYFHKLLNQSGNKNGMLGKTSIYRKYAEPILEEFSNLFIDRKYKEAGQKLFELVGLGPGLTPSGDDFIIGVMASFKFCGMKKETFADLTELIINKAKSKTNIISFNILRQGALGGFLEWIEDMALSVIHGNYEDIEKAFKNMLKIGSSSGSDISAGILFGIEEAMNLS